eukprot:evm.model.scf_785.5 EVM.evm.TU.scf_785.5   scf_785:46127-48219(-)
METGISKEVLSAKPHALVCCDSTSSQLPSGVVPSRPSIVEKRKQSLPGTAVVLDEETRRLLAKSSEWRAQLNASVSESDEDADLQDPEEAHEISASSGESSNESEGEQAEASIILKLRDRKNRVVKAEVVKQRRGVKSLQEVCCPTKGLMAGVMSRGAARKGQI